MSKAQSKRLIKAYVNYNDEWTKEQEELTQQLLQAKYSRFSARKFGAPTVLTADLVERFIMAARQGLPINLCCDFCLIDPQLFHQWREWANRIKRRIEPILERAYVAQGNGESYKFSKAEQHSLRLSAHETTLMNFFDRLCTIKAEYGLKIMTGLNIAALNGNVNAATWLLKSVFPEHYSDVNVGLSDGEAAQTGYAYIEVNPEEPPKQLEERNVTPNREFNGNGDVETLTDVQ